MVRRGDVAWAGTAVRIAKNLGVAQRPDVKAIVDAANTETAPLRNRVIGAQAEAGGDILRDPARLKESEMGNLVTDAMLARYPEAEAAITNSGGLRADLLYAPAQGAPDGPGEITFGEVFAVLPFGNSTVVETVTGAQLTAALVNGFKPPCGDVAGGTGRTPQVAGLRIRFTCSGTTAVIAELGKVADDGTVTPIGPTDTIRIVTNDFMFAGGDGYTALSGGTDVLQTGDVLLDVVIEYVTAISPVELAEADVEGRITGP
jgi:2',3'-cyclic-nucleotide 2'-phosphodiesterase (5'-nucleotidase family)